MSEIPYIPLADYIELKKQLDDLEIDYAECRKSNAEVEYALDDVPYSGPYKNGIEYLKTDLEKLRTNESASKSVIQKWAAERVEMVAEIERLKRGEYICTRCGLRNDGDGVAGEF